MNNSTRVILVGLGTVADTHLKVLERLADVTLTAGVDPAPSKSLAFRGREVPVYPTVHDAAAAHDPSHVVVTTPTPTHAAVCDAVTKAFPDAAILIEKPAAERITDARHLLSELEGRKPVDVAYHMAFSPESLWAAQLASAQHETLGPPIAIVASFTDPYEADFDTARTRFGNSWIDSGINALSVINHFAEPIERTSLRPLGPEPWSAFEGRISCRTADGEIEALILTNWHVTAPARTTRVIYADGAELVMDHHGVAGYLIRHGEVSEFFGSDGSVPRRESHYRALYHHYLVEGRNVLPFERSLRLHEILLGPADKR